MSALPVSPTIFIQEAVYGRILDVVRSYDEGADIILKAWQNDIETKLAKALASLGTFIFVDAVSYSPVDSIAKGPMKAQMQITVRNNGTLKSADTSKAAGWDVEDLAAVLVNHLDGWNLQDDQSIYHEARLTNYKSNILGLKKAVVLTIEFEINP